jgi:hypothetical protein
MRQVGPAYGIVLATSTPSLERVLISGKTDSAYI